MQVTGTNVTVINQPGVMNQGTCVVIISHPITDMILYLAYVIKESTSFFPDRVT